MQDLNMPKSVFWWLVAATIFFVLLFTHGVVWFHLGAAEAMAKKAADAAVVTALAPVCVDQFKRSNNASANLASLKKITSEYEQEAFVTKGGWATIPGSDSPNSGVAKLCAQMLTGS